MTQPRLTHSTFALERRFSAPPAKAFQAFADPETKAKWFEGPADSWRLIDKAMDFREGGHEHNEGQWGVEGPISRFDATYHEILENTRIVYDYEMRIDGVKLSISLATLEFWAAGGGTTLLMTEQGVYFDEHDSAAQREAGTRDLLDAVARVVDS